MLRRCIIYLIFIIGIGNYCAGQQIADYRFNMSFGRSIEPGVMHLELGLNRDLFNFLDNKLRLGFGIRAGIQDNNGIMYTSAKKEFKKMDGKIDTLQLDRVQSFGFNFNAQGEYYLLDWLSAGISLDLVGISTGAEVTGKFLPGTDSQKAGFTSKTNVNAKPTSANAFSFGDRKGSLNSQLFVRMEASQRLGFRLGYAWLSNEYTTEKVQGVTDQYRFQNNKGVFFIGFSFNKFDNK